MHRRHSGRESFVRRGANEMEITVTTLPSNLTASERAVLAALDEVLAKRVEQIMADIRRLEQTFERFESLIPIPEIRHIVAYLADDERKDYECRNELERRGHIYEAIAAVSAWLSAVDANGRMP